MGLKDYFQHKKRCVKQGDLIAVPIDEGKARFVFDAKPASEGEEEGEGEEHGEFEYVALGPIPSYVALLNDWPFFFYIFLMIDTLKKPIEIRPWSFSRSQTLKSKAHLSIRLEICST